MTAETDAMKVLTRLEARDAARTTERAFKELSASLEALKQQVSELQSQLESHSSGSADVEHGCCDAGGCCSDD